MDTTFYTTAIRKGYLIPNVQGISKEFRVAAVASNLVRDDQVTLKDDHWNKNYAKDLYSSM
jgi:hypothetical protein